MTIRNRSQIMLTSGAIVFLILLLGWTAFRFNADTENPNNNLTEPSMQEQADLVVDGFTETSNEAEKALTYATLQTQIQARLIVIEAGLEAETITDATVEEVQSLRKDLQKVYSETSVETQEQLDEIDSQLAQVEKDARRNTAAALLTVQELIEKIREDIMNEEA